jgi:serine/threonine protein kinase
LGLSRDAEYYNAETKEIPYKWSAPEVVKYGKSTTASDVWSFGVVMWEIFSNGESKLLSKKMKLFADSLQLIVVTGPYQGMSNQQVIDQVINGTHRLSQPKNCPEGVYKLMMKCWSAAVEARPSFNNIQETLRLQLKELDFEQDPKPAVEYQRMSATTETVSADYQAV